VNIRQESPADYAEVYELVKMSFATTTPPDDTVADYLNEVRTKDTFIPELSLVAVDNNGKIVGQVVLYETDIIFPLNICSGDFQSPLWQSEIAATIGKRTELLLSPICVHPDYFRQGIARALINNALDLARKMRYKAVFLCGEPNFYRKLGFVPTFAYEIYHHTDENKNAQ